MTEEGTNLHQEIVELKQEVSDLKKRLNHYGFSDNYWTIEQELSLLFRRTTVIGDRLDCNALTIAKFMEDTLKRQSYIDECLLILSKDPSYGFPPRSVSPVGVVFSNLPKESKKKKKKK